MEEFGRYDQYPLRMVLVSVLVSVAVYAIGAYILAGVGLVFAAIYLLFVFLLEFRLLRGHCTDCYYYGRTCAFGRGRLSAIFFQKGNPDRFCKMTVTWKDILPDFLIFIIPAVVGIALLISSFSWVTALLTAALLLLGFAGNALVRGQIACRYCRQREIGCPAERLFRNNR